MWFKSGSIQSSKQKGAPWNCAKWRTSTGRREHKRKLYKAETQAGHLLQNDFPSVKGRHLLGRLPTSVDECFLTDWLRFHFQICCITQGTQTRALKQPRGVRRFKRVGTYVYLWLIHVDVWQKPTQYCKAIILQFNIIFNKENRKEIPFPRDLKL